MLKNMKRGSPSTSSPAASRGRPALGRAGQVGLLLTAFLLAIGLGAMGAVNRVNVERTAKQAIRGRALDRAVGASSAVVRLREGRIEKMRQVLPELIDSSILQLDVVLPSGKVTASSRQERNGLVEPKWRALLRSRNADEKNLILREHDSKGTFEIWLPLRRGRGHRRMRRWMEGRGSRFSGRGMGQKRTTGGGRGMGRGRWKDDPGPGGPGRMKNAFLRVLVRVSDPEVQATLQQARLNQVLSTGAAAALMVLSVLLFLAALRTSRLQREMERNRALSEMGEMAAVLAHEIRNPLAVIKGNAQLLGEKNELSGNPKLLTVVEQSQRLERLVNGLLDYARPRPLSTRQLRLDELTEKVCRLVEDEAVGKQVAVLKDLEPVTVTGDEDQLTQVLINLIRNGLQASPQGSAVTVRLLGRGDRVWILVSDAGEGVPEDKREEIFNPFFTTKEHGTGLGLPISRRIAEAHGGSLHVEGSVSSGARFVLTLPAKGPKSPLP